MFSTFALRNERSGSFLKGWLGKKEKGRPGDGTQVPLSDREKRKKKIKNFLFCFNKNFFYLCSPARNGIQKRDACGHNTRLTGRRKPDGI